MARLTSGLELLEAVASYAMAGASRATPQLLSQPTPCAGWDLKMLLKHLSDSIEVVNEALTAGQVRFGRALDHDGPAADPVGGLRRHAATLVGTCAGAPPHDRPVIIGDRDLTANSLAVTGAIEIAVHGWDIWAACGTRRPIPARLAAVLLPIAPLFIPDGIRPGLFADPVRLTGTACPGDQLVAFLGREPRLTPASIG